MRLGLLADVHANRIALDAVIAALERRGVDGWLCAGDVVGYGPAPDACASRVRELGAVTVAGNHDLIALGRLSAAQCTAFAADSLRWTSEVISAETRAWLSTLPARATPTQAIVMAHGSVDDPTEYVDHRSEAAEQLALVSSRWPAARLLILGHTHRPAVLDAAGRGLVRSDGPIALPRAGAALVNPGSAGQPRGSDPRARAAVLDLERWEVELVAVEWDIEANRAALRAVGRPEASNWAPPPPPWARVVRRLRRLRARATPGRPTP